MCDVQLSKIVSDRAERAARAEERKNEEEKNAWYKEEISECEKKIQYLNARRIELDEAKSKLFAELKEVVAKSKDRTQNQAAFYSQLIQPQTRNKDRNTDVGSVSIRQFHVDGLQNSGAVVTTSAYPNLQYGSSSSISDESDASVTSVTGKSRKSQS
ncbi:unnamed protein product [Onchocerca ochengi]|uniref:RAB6-interacting golgin n=1 Tax=Onchocerca ochengi TaxID=42157 RepID=A0A182ENU4_ONCOC|nr:unnamed protein product [Onchocerca ochengi]